LIKRMIAVLAVPATAGAVLLGAAGAALASTGPTTYNNGQTEGGGYAVTHAKFRFVQDSVYLRPTSKFAATDDGVSWETHLYGTFAGGAVPVKAVLGIGGDPQTSSTYGVSASVNGTPVTMSGDSSFSAGQTVTEAISYNKASGVIDFSAYDVNGDSAFGQANVGIGDTFGIAEVFGGIDTGSGFVPPSAPLLLGRFTAVMLTTYSGVHGTIGTSSFVHNKTVVTSDGTSTGTVMVAPSGLNKSGNGFSSYIEPAI
jgi:hypothetical protein